MSTPRYRIGNDLTVLWAINNKDGSPYDLSRKEVRLFVTHPRDRIEVDAVIQTLQSGVVNNVIRWDFSGLDQKVLGKYRLTVEIFTSESRKLIRKDITEAFELVSRSEMEIEENGEEVMDGGDLYLSSTLDIYRFGIPQIRIGEDGFWYIDNVKTGVSALGGGPGLVKNIYTEQDFDKAFEQASVIDTFNAFAVASLAKRIKFLEGDFYTQVRNLTDVLFSGDPQTGQALVWDGTYWTAGDVAAKGDNGASSKDIEKLLQLLDWFEYDPENNMIRANHGLYSFGPLASGGTIEGVQVSAINRLARLRDVAINDVKDGQSLVYDEESMMWVNRTVEGGEGGSASLTESIKAGVKVGNINVGAMLEKGMTFTEFVELMFSEDITKVSPSVTIANTPAVNEVGDTVIINPTYTYTDGYFKNAKGEDDAVNPKAQCEAGRPRYLLNGSELSSIPYELSTDAPKKYTIEINLPYSESKAKVYKKSGDEYTEKIPSGTAKDDAEFNVCYKWFWGYVEKGKTMSSEVIRALRHSGFISPGASSSTLLSGQEDTEAGKSVVIACPEEYRLSGVKDMAMGGGESMSSKFKQGDDVVVTCGKTHNKKYHVYIFTPTSGAGSIKIGNIEIAKN